jgi:hypothetical protein
MVPGVVAGFRGAGAFMFTLGQKPRIMRKAQ